MLTATGLITYGHAHNTFVQYLWHYGVLGFVVYAGFVLGFILLLGGLRVATKLELRVHDALYPFLLLLTIQSEPVFKIDMTYKGVYIIIFIIGIREVKINNARIGLTMR
jgi:O-antigen ligase